MMHWKATYFVLALFIATLAVAGCSQPCCLPDYDAVTRRAGLPADLATNPDISSQRALEDPVGVPATVDDVDRKPNYVTLSECIAMALENGTVGVQSLNNVFNSINISSQAFTISPVINDLVQFNGAQVTGDDAIRVFALQPALTFADIEASLARYDVVARSILGFHTADQNPLGPNGFENGNFTAFGASLEKALPTGGLSSITFGSPTNAGTNPGVNFYSRFNQTSFVTAQAPGYTPNLTFALDQPLLRGFGPSINALLPQHPTSTAQQYPGSAAASAPALAIAHINFNQQRADFERIVNYMVLNVEAAYYVLYGTYVNLYSTEQAMRQAHTVWKISKAKYEAGSIPITEFAQTRTQYEDFRSQRITALNNVLERERALRVLCGKLPEDGTRWIPVDTPTVQQFLPETKEAREAVWRVALKETMALRPELTLAREDVKRRQMELIREQNGLLPDVRLEASYALHSFGTRLDGDGDFLPGQTDNALRDLASGRWADYNIGLNASMPLGFRAQHASVRQANLRLTQAFLVLRDQELKAENNLTVAWRSLTADYDLVQSRREQRIAAAEQVEARFKEFVAGKKTVDFLLTAQQQWAAALSAEYQVIANYNLDLVLFQFAKGTLLPHNNIHIMEGELPQCVQVRAVENERERALALACKEHAAAIHQPCDADHGLCGVPVVGDGGLQSMPALMMDQETKERLPLQMQHLPPVSATSPAAPMSSFGDGTAAAVAPASQPLSSAPTTQAIFSPASNGINQPPMPPPALEGWVPGGSR